MNGQMKKIVAMLTILMLILSGFNLVNKVEASETDLEGFILTKENDNKVNVGDKVTINVNLNVTTADGFQGLIVYDNDLELDSIDFEQTVKSNYQVSYRPVLENELEVQYKNKKGISFTAAAIGENNVLAGNKKIITLVFDTEKCSGDTEYEFIWDTANTEGFGPKTYIKADKKRKTIITEGTTIETNHVEDNGNNNDGEGSGGNSSNNNNDGEGSGGNSNNNNNDGEGSGGSNNNNNNDGEGSGGSNNNNNNNKGNNGNNNSENEDDNGSKGSDKENGNSNNGNKNNSNNNGNNGSNNGSYNGSNNGSKNGNQTSNEESQKGSSNGNKSSNGNSASNKASNKATDDTTSANSGKSKISQTGNTNTIIFSASIIGLIIYGFIALRKFGKLKGIK